MKPKSTFEQLRSASPLITVGILTADMMSLRSELELIESAGVKLLHFDIMDGCFCPSLTIGTPFVKAVRTNLLKDVHLMIEDPLEKIESFVDAGADIVTINIESSRHIHRALQLLGDMENANDRTRGILRGVALNPGTPLQTLHPLMDELEMVFLLGVNPGWGGQKFIPSTRQKLTRLIDMVRDAKRDILVGVDGGINKTNIADVAEAGADIIVTGSAIFDGKAPFDNATFMLHAVKNAVKH